MSSCVVVVGIMAAPPTDPNYRPSTPLTHPSLCCPPSPLHNTPLYKQLINSLWICKLCALAFVIVLHHCTIHRYKLVSNCTLHTVCCDTEHYFIVRQCNAIPSSAPSNTVVLCYTQCHTDETPSIRIFSQFISPWMVAFDRMKQHHWHHDVPFGLWICCMWCSK